MSSIICKYLTKVYKSGSYGLLDFSIEIKSGEFISVIGPSGSGKTTLLKVISGLLTLDAGELYFDDILMNNIPAKDRDVAMMFQEYVLYPNMNVYDNIAAYLRFKKEDELIIKEKVLNAAKLFDLEALLNRRIKELSGGQKQRVALSKIFVRSPKIVLLDEPLSNVDEKSKDVYKENILKLKRSLTNTTFIYVTHNLKEAFSLADRILILSNGRNISYLTPKQLIDYPASVDIAKNISIEETTFIKGCIKNQKLYIDEKEVSSDSIYLNSIESDYEEAYIYKNGDYYIAFDNNYNLIGGYKEKVNIKAILDNDKLVVDNQTYQLDEEILARFIVKKKDVTLSLDVSKLHLKKKTNDISLNVKVIQESNRYLLVLINNHKYMLPNIYDEKEFTLYYSIDDLNIIDENNAKLLAHYKIYENKTKSNLLFKKSKNDNNVIIPMKAIKFSKRKGIAIEVIAEEIIDDKHKLVYAIMSGFTHYITFVCNINEIIYYKKKNYVELNEERLIFID